MANPCPPLTITSPSTLPGGTVGQAYSYQIQTSGGTPPVTFEVISGALPAGLFLDDNGLLSGTPSAVGSSSFTVLAADSCTGAPARTDQKSFTLVISDDCPSLHIVTSATLPAGRVGQAYDQQLETTGGVPPIRFGLVSGSLPPGHAGGPLRSVC